MKESTSTLTSKGQVTIPAEIRKHLGIGAGAKVAFVVNGEGDVVVRPARYTLASVRGIVPALPGRETIDFDDQIEEAMEDLAEQIVARMGGR
jgi:AbrB family looped-hinge helix DNA binding protein